MIHEPPIDKLVDRVGCRYVLAVLAAKRARQILSQPGYEEGPGKEKPISQAVNEISAGKLTFTND